MLTTDMATINIASQYYFKETTQSKCNIYMKDNYICPARNHERQLNADF